MMPTSSKRFILLLLFLAYGWVAVYGQSGFINIDCGKPKGSSYVDTVTGLTYTSDEGYIDFDVGEIHHISSEYQEVLNYSHSSDLRSFPNSNRNCYTLGPLSQGTSYIFRTFFLYGNYDGLNRLPKFDIYLGVDLWQTMEISDASEYYFSEIIALASSETMSLCLADTGSGTPFVSAIDVRSVEDMYSPEVNTTRSVVKVARMDFGATYRGHLRYKSDTYDRMWIPCTQPEWTTVSTASTFDSSGAYHLPLPVMSTAVVPANNFSLNINITTSMSSPPFRYYLLFHFAEIQSVASTRSRIMDILVNNEDWNSNTTINYMESYTIYGSEVSTYEGLNISLFKAKDSVLPPIINALEFYMDRQLTGIGTDGEDVDAITQIKRFYHLHKNWMGDPCLPKDFLWNGIDCSYDYHDPSRITSLNLSYNSLTGVISPSLGNLTKLQSLDLSSNKLKGKIPVFLGKLPNLVFLNLSGNYLSGAIPDSLAVKADSGELTLSVDERNRIPKINSSSSDIRPSLSGSREKKHKRLPIILSISICSAVALLMIVSFTVWYFRKRKQVSGKEIQGPAIFQVPSNNIFELTSFQTHNRKFTYNDLVAATGNFSVIIGKGGFGNVYRGTLRDSADVAVKMLLQYSSQGHKQFQAETRLMSNIHHRNLVTLVGYCNDENHLALVYDYMANGSLADLLGDPKRAEMLSWKDRLRISFEAAQGLAYLHDGCEPAIVHRDVKPNNILLDSNLEVKIGDFGLSRIFDSNTFTSVITDVVGTIGYLDPEYFEAYKLTKKSDVYSFGVVLLELITGLPAMVGGVKLVNRVKPMINSGDLTGMVDQNLRGHISNSIWKVIEIAISCTSSNSVDRPSMADVVVMLRDCLNLEDSHVQRSHGSKPYSDGTSDSSSLMFHSNRDSTFNPGPR